MITLNETSVASEVQCVSDSTDRQIDALGYELRPGEVPEANAQKSIFRREVGLVSRRGVEHSRNPIRRKAILDSAEVIHVA
jgi:hypothetical protein